jgi:hypothetical protein
MNFGLRKISRDFFEKKISAKFSQVTKQKFEAIKGTPHCETWMSKSEDVKLGEGDGK